MQKLEKFPANAGKVKFEGLVHLLRYSRDNNKLGLDCYANINYAPVSEQLRQASIKIENQFICFYDSSCQYCPYTGRSIGA